MCGCRESVLLKLRCHRFYCNTLPSLVSLAGIKTAEAQSFVTNGAVAWSPDTRDISSQVQLAGVNSQQSVQQPPAGQMPPVVDPARNPALVPQPPAGPPGEPPADPAAQEPAVPIPVPPAVQVPDPTLQSQQPQPGVGNVPAGTTLPVAAEDSSQLAGAAEAAALQMNATRSELDSLNVEIQKKFALSFACLVFVLFGPPIALRFPRGGVGVTLGVGIVVFGLYYICLMGGETLSDRGQLPPPVSMWIANVLFALMGLALMWKVESTTDKSRGGGIRDWWAERRARKTLVRKAA